MPCDDGGIAACPYTHSHGVSPGSITLGAEDLLALEVHQKCASLGRELALALLDIALTPTQADGLLMRLDYLATMDRLQQAQERHRQWRQMSRS